MRTSDEMNELFEALSKAQAKIKHAAKSADNPFYSSKYAPLDVVWDACRKELTDNDIFIWQGVVHAKQTEGEQERVKAFLITRLCHKSGQWMEDDGQPLLLRPDKQGVVTMQALGSAQAYARRYGLMAAVGIAPADATEDDGEAAQKEWVGPLGKAALKKKAHELSAAIPKAANADELMNIQHDYMDVINQMQHDLPSWYYGDGDDIKGAKGAIETRSKQLAELDAIGEDEPIVKPQPGRS